MISRYLGDKRTFADLLTDEGLDFVKSYADAVGPWKPLSGNNRSPTVIDRNGDGKITINRPSQSMASLMFWSWLTTKVCWSIPGLSATMTTVTALPILKGK